VEVKHSFSELQNCDAAIFYGSPDATQFLKPCTKLVHGSGIPIG